MTGHEVSQGAGCYWTFCVLSADWAGSHDPMETLWPSSKLPLVCLAVKLNFEPKIQRELKGCSAHFENNRGNVSGSTDTSRLNMEVSPPFTALCVMSGRSAVATTPAFIV